MHNPHSEPQQSGPTAPPASGILLLPRPRLTGDAWAGQAAGNRAAELAHDARNLFSALDLYCELLATPGVLAPGFRHYAEDLRLVAGSGARLIEALSQPTSRATTDTPQVGGLLGLRRRPFPEIEDLAAELVALEAPLRALAGPGIRLEVECMPCAGLLALNSEDLLRILFNLVANAAEAISAAKLRRAPFLRITAQRGGGASFLDGHFDSGIETVVLSVRDNGPGIAANNLPHIFDPGFSTRRRSRFIETAELESADDRKDLEGGEDTATRGLGLSIVRQLVESAGGAVRAVTTSGLGASFDIELPILSSPRPASPSFDRNLRPSIPARKTGPRNDEPEEF
jgi:signal transduction histidine kinase